MLWKNKKSGELYVILETCKLKDGEFFIDGVLYRPIKDSFVCEKYVRSIASFKEKFDEVKENDN
jgi:hypothetical protein